MATICQLEKTTQHSMKKATWIAQQLHQTGYLGENNTMLKFVKLEANNTHLM